MITGNKLWVEMVDYSFVWRVILPRLISTAAILWPSQWEKIVNWAREHDSSWCYGCVRKMCEELLDNIVECGSRFQRHLLDESSDYTDLLWDIAISDDKYLYSDHVVCMWLPLRQIHWLRVSALNKLLLWWYCLDTGSHLTLMTEWQLNQYPTFHGRKTPKPKKENGVLQW